MKRDLFYKNGFILKSYEETDEKENANKNYWGIGRCMTWPLDVCVDKISIELNKEAEERWFGYWDERPWAVPDLEYLRRYVQHCNELNIKVFCLQIESKNSILTSSENLPIEEYLGYDYADANMQVSCLYDDVMATDTYRDFYTIKQKLNRYGLMDSLEGMNQYLDTRRKLIKQGYDMGEEEYYSLRIVKLARVVIDK